MEPTILNGEEFNKKFAGTKFYAITGFGDVHVTGLNNLDFPIVFTELNHILQTVNTNFHHNWIVRQVTIPNDEHVVIKADETIYQKFRTKQPILSEPLRLDSFFGSEGLNKITEDDCFAAVLSYAIRLILIPEHSRTYKLCHAAVNTSGAILQYVPDELRTHEICLSAISNYGDAIEYVPDELMSEEFCWIAANKRCSLRFIPERFRTLEICLKIVYDVNDYHMPHVPNELKEEVIRLKTIELKEKEKANRAFMYNPLRSTDLLFNPLMNIDSLLPKPNLHVRHVSIPRSLATTKVWTKPDSTQINQILVLTLADETLVDNQKIIDKRLYNVINKSKKKLYNNKAFERQNKNINYCSKQNRGFKKSFR